MPLTRDFKETIMEELRARRGLRDAMLCEATDCLLGGELEIGKSILRDIINATIGFEALSAEVDIPVKSLMRMLGPKGNPQARNLFAVIGALQKDAGIELRVTDAHPAKAKRIRPPRRKASSGLKVVERPHAVHAGFAEAPATFKRR